ncbi:TIGR00153 family protein [Thiohalomonas denitrificans]|uniref:TIGR00153 family protein n=1 Tax=Thiohalomonas denitrificans TaxID=415747 RepID=UPI0026EBD74F|nr:TIGR00153 family protein [Thiohalomonas denitrificans]
MAPRNYISSLFGTSPVAPLQKHMAEVQACISELIPFFEAVLADDWERAAAEQQRIADLEDAADDLKHDLRLHLPSGWLMAMSRRDLLEVLTVQDRIANKAKDIAGLILGRKMTFPDPIGTPILNFVRRCVDASGQARSVIDELDELVETGFRGHEVELVQSMITELDRIESDTDAMQVEIRALLFKQEKDLPPVDVMFMYRIIEWIGDLADLAQRVGSRLELMLAR